MRFQEKKYEVQVYYSSFCNHTVDAKSRFDALQKAREQRVSGSEIMSNLEIWPEADTVEETTEDYGKS